MSISSIFLHKQNFFFLKKNPYIDFEIKTIIIILDNFLRKTFDYFDKEKNGRTKYETFRFRGGGYPNLKKILSFFCVSLPYGKASIK